MELIMKHLIIFTLLILCNFLNLSAYLEQISRADTIDAGIVYVGEEKIITIDLSNLSDDKTIVFNKIVSIDDYGYYQLDFTPFTMMPKESFSGIKVKITPLQNVDSYCNLFFNVSMNNSSLYFPVVIKTKAMFTNKYYDETQNLWGADLLNKLRYLISNHQSFSYKNARKILWTGPDRINGNVECIYTGKIKQIDDEPDFAVIDQEGFNTEHVWARAYGADDEPELSDMFHIYPTEKTSNTKRDNYPFDYVVSNVAYQDGGSKLGKNTKGEIAFEVRDISKGNIARSMFYFSTRYGNLKNYLTSQEETLREWSSKDLPDAKETARNDSIYKYQLNRNPYIDYPQFLQRIPNLSANGGTFLEVSEIKPVDNIYILPDNLKGKEFEAQIFYFNQGNIESEVESIKILNNPDRFSIDYNNTNMLVKPNSYQKTTVKFNSSGLDGMIDDSAIVRVDFKNNSSQISKIIVKSNVSDVKEQISNQIKISNNPSDNKQKILIEKGFLSSEINAELYSVDGSFISNLSDMIYDDGKYYTINLDNSKIKLPLGIYIIYINDNIYNYSEKILIIK